MLRLGPGTPIAANPWPMRAKKVSTDVQRESMRTVEVQLESNLVSKELIRQDKIARIDQLHLSGRAYWGRRLLIPDIET